MSKKQRGAADGSRAKTPRGRLQLFIGSRPMDKWDLRFCELARFVSEWSKDPKAKVGAVVFARRGGDVTIGYNGFPMGVEDSAERLTNSKLKLELVVHAEQNALIAAGSRAEGSTIFVWGKPVCARCAGSIIQAGVKRVVALSPESVVGKSKWKTSGRHAKTMFVEAGVAVDFYEEGNRPNAQPLTSPPTRRRRKQAPKK